jgi:hypothetical protein
MEGYKHLIVVLAGFMGLLLGGVLIDLDHTGTWTCKWNNFWKLTVCPLQQGVFHNRIIMLSISLFSMCLGVAIMFHYMMDFIK